MVLHSHFHNMLGRDGWWERKIPWHAFSSKRTTTTTKKKSMKTLNQYWTGHEETSVQVLSLSHLPSIITASPTCPLRWIISQLQDYIQKVWEVCGGPALVKQWTNQEVQTGNELVQKHGRTIPLTKKMQKFHFEPKPVYFLDCAAPTCANVLLNSMSIWDFGATHRSWQQAYKPHLHNLPRQDY